MKIVLRSAIAAVLCVAAASHAPGSSPGADTSTLGSAPDEQQKKTDSAATEMKAQLQHLREVVNAAKKPEDLDPVLFDLQKYQNGNFDGVIAPENQALYQQLAAAAEFTKEWQNYLSHLAAGQTDMARSDLSTMSQNNNDVGIIPRSRILALLARPMATAPANNAAAPAPPSDAQKIVDGINTLDDLEPALGQLNGLAQRDEIAREYAQHLAPMVEVYDDLKQGLPTSVTIDFMGGVSGAGISGKVNSMLLKFVLQHYFDTYTGAPPADSESPAAYATRVKNDALAGHDWTLLKKALSAHAYLYRNIAGTAGADDETSGLGDLITGINQEEAGQYSLAVGSYQTALKAGSLDIPAKYIGERLDAIKRDHPTEYDSGMASFLSPPMPQYYPGMNPAMYNPTMFPGQRYRPGMPGYPGNPSGPQPANVLSIPAAKASAPPAPAPPAPSPATNAPASAK